MSVPEMTGADAGPAAGAAGAAGAAVGGFTDPAAPWQRLSPRSMIVRPLTDLTRLLPVLAGLVFLHAPDGQNLVIGLVAAILAIGTGLVHWATTRYLVTDERVYLRHGLLNIRRLSVARDRIRTVDVNAHPLHRLLGVCRVSIGTGRNDFRTGEGFRLDGLTRADAESLRQVLLAGVPSPATASATAPATASAAGGAGEPGHEIARMRLAWVGFAPLTMTGLVVLSALFGFAYQLTRAANYDIISSGPGRRVVADYAALSLGQRVLVTAAVILAGYVVVATAGYIAVYWKFRLARHGTDTVRVTRGLLSVRATTISLSRLRGVEISEPLLLRAARGARCIAITTGLRVGRGAEHEGSVLLPPAPRPVAVQVAAEVLGAPRELCDGPLRPHGGAARTRRYTRALAAAVSVAAPVGALAWARNGPAWIWIGSLALLPAGALVAADRYRSLGHRLADGWLVTRFGSLARHRSIIATDAIIGWRIHQTWFQRRKGLMTLTATTAAGHQHYSVRDVPVAEGITVARAATAGLLEPFLS